MMKELIVSSMLFLSGCCAFTSQDCGCVPPNPELDIETGKWITPYDTPTYFLFEDSLGNIDSLKVSRTSATEFCGGDECGSNCKSEIATLESVNNFNLRFTTTAALTRELRINDPEKTDNLIYLEFDVLNESILSKDAHTTASMDDNFDWGDKKIKVLIINCENGSDCSGYEMKNMVISREYGLIKYTTPDDNIWKKIN